MPKFKVGDRVKCIAEHDGNGAIVGQKGTVRYVGDFGIISVEFDNDVHGHTLQAPYHCEQGHGWNIDAYKLKLIPKPEHDLKIIIYSQGNKTFAKVIVGKRTVETECAVCSLEDTFSILTGAQIVLARLAHKHNAKPVLSKAALDKALKNFEIIE